MGGEGSIMGMIVNLRNNKNLLRKRNPFQRKHRFEKLRSDYIRASPGIIESKKLTKEELSKVRERVIRLNRKESLKTVCFAIIVLVIITLLFIPIIRVSFANQKAFEQQVIEKKTTKYLNYIDDGDSWLKKRQWNNAIFQYLLAKNIFPNEYDINYRLALAYASKCKFEKLSCESAQEQLSYIEKTFPNKSELIAVRQMLKE